MSLRRSLSIAFSIAFTILGMAAALWGLTGARREVWDILDLQQRQIAHLVGDGSGLIADGAHRADPGTEDGYVVQIAFPDARPTLVSRAGVAFPETVTEGFSSFDDASGRWRLFTRVGDGRIVRVAQLMVEREELAADAAWNAALPALVAIPLSWAIVWLLVGKILGRLDPLVRRVEGRRLDDTRPVELGAGPTELRPLVEAINRGFSRQRESAEQQKQFLSDAAHELRTPLAALTLQIENLHRANTDPTLEEALCEAIGGVRRASLLTTRLLQLARQEAHRTTAATDAVRLDELALRVIGDLYWIAEAEGVDLGSKTNQTTIIPGDEMDLLALIEILVDNAVRYTGRGGTVDVSVETRGGHPMVIVDDTGPGIPEEAMERVFDRFYRIDETGTVGSGLGLAIARVIATRHGAIVALENRKDHGGLRATVRFPPATGEAADHP